jgi:hypothetical protein
LWAEDGLFTYSADKNGLETLLQPYRGYLSTAPRLLAWLTQLTPMSGWATTQAVAVTFTTSLLSVFIYLLLRNLDVDRGTSSLSALLIVIFPLMGAEAIGTYANLNIVLSFVGLILVASVSKLSELSIAWRHGCLVVWTLIILTVPTMVIAALFAYDRRLLSRRSRFSRNFKRLTLSACLVQFSVFVMTRGDRGSDFHLRRFSTLASNLGSSLAAIVPGRSVRDNTFLRASGELSKAAFLTIALMSLLFAFYTLIKSRPETTARTRLTSVLVAGGFFLFLAAGVAGDESAVEASSRYYLYFTLPLTAAAIIALGTRCKSTKARFAALAIVFLCWWPSFPVSDFRNTGPTWLESIESADRDCFSSQSERVYLTFAPNWPGDVSPLQGKIDSSEWSCS